MRCETQMPSEAQELHYTSLFEAMPGSCILLKNDAPRYTILAATPEYLAQTGTTKEGIIGKGIFEAFPGNPDDPTDTGTHKLKGSLEEVVRCKLPHNLPAQRYDVEVEDGNFTERYWKAVNKPVLAINGDVLYIVHEANDITAQIKAVEMEKQMRGLAESEQELRSLVLQAPIVICVMDAVTLVSQVANANFVEIAGRPLDEIVGWMYWDTFSEARPFYEAALNKVVAEGITFRANEVEVPLIRYGKKEIVHVTFVYEPLKDSAGTVKKVVVWVLDNTPQVIARRKVTESEERFRSMADASPVMIWTLDENGNSTYYNTKAAEFTGHTEAELKEGKSWQVAIHPNDIEFASGVVGNAVMNLRPYEMECRMQRSDGEWRWLLNQGTPRFGRNGEYFGFVGSSIDITELKESQQKLQTALEQVRLSKEAAELGTFDMDLIKGTMHWDDRCRTLFGINHQGPVTYEKDFVKGLHPDDRERITKVIDNLFIKSISNGDYDVEYRTVSVKDGTIRWVRAKGKVYFNESDKPARFIGSVLDITAEVMALQKIERLVEERTKELAQANERLKDVNRELQRSNQHLEEFAHAASHDLKEPIRKIHIFTNQLKQQLSGQITEKATGLFNRIENASQRMGSLIDDLLLYSHVSQRPHEMETVDLNEKVRQALEDMDLEIEAKGAVINVGQLPMVNGYLRQLQQLFQNLLSNAIKYSKENVAPVIDITADEVTNEGKPFHLIRISDNGIGFEQEYEDRIFKIFSRLHGKGEYSGTGVGLSIVKKVVENHEGFIKVISNLGAGTTFEVYLPVQMQMPK